MSFTFDFWNYVALGIIVFVTEISKDIYKFIKKELWEHRKNKQTEP